MTTIIPRRELATRRTEFAARLSASLKRANIRPNTVSVAGVVFAVLAMTAFAMSPSCGAGTRAMLLVWAAAAIQLRLLCNLLDGMLAVEHGLATATGPLFNEIPDRLADIAILVGAGYAVPELFAGVTLGWSAAIGALLTAYVRSLAGSLGLTQHFIGPMAKPHRMFVLTLGALSAAVEIASGAAPYGIAGALLVITIGAGGTAWRRVVRTVAELEGR